VKGLVATFGTIWRLAVPYFKSDDRWPGRILLGGVIAMALGRVALDVLFNLWNNRFYNALQDRNWDSFVYEFLYFCVLAAIYIVLAVYQLYLTQWLQIRWRRWLTAGYLRRWLDDNNHYRMQVLGDAADNPDQRIAEDVRLFVEGAMNIGIGILTSAVTLASFIVLLWNLSASAPVHLFGSAWAIPGYLVWAALLYAVLGTWLTHLIGRPLIGHYFNQQRFEADFRFNLVRVRENGEQIALLAGEPAERERLLDRFAAVIGNWFRIMTQTKKVTFFTAGYSQVAIVFPYIVASPAYFADKMTLGGLMQTASAFSSVQTALSYFITSYREIAEWRAVVERLSGFERAIVNGRAVKERPPVVTAEARPGATRIEASDLVVRLPSGDALVTAPHLDIAAGDHVLVNGPSGSGKSTMFRAIAGIWPFGSGRVILPDDADVMMLPQRPYFPVGSLMAAVSYPALPERFDEETVRNVLTAVGLSGLATRLHEECHWNRMLSLGEQQRLALARAILHEPRYLFLDEATASLDEPAEAQLYRLLHERLPAATIVSIGHRSTLAAFHRRRLELARDGARYRLREETVKAAAG
jgi:putative ATP-binding cassette transporter